MNSHRMIPLLAVLPLLGGCFLFSLGDEGHPPECQFTAPAADDVFEPGATVELAFTVADEGDDLQEIELRVGGVEGSTILPGGTGAHTYSWDSGAGVSARKLVVINLSDSAGDTGQCTLDVHFNIQQTPKLTTEPVAKLTPFYAEIGGTITNPGLGTTYDRGIVWSTQPGPTVSDNKTDEDRSENPFVSRMGDLAPGTTYYVRAYATNSYGTAYGEEVSFTTPAAAFGDEGTVTDVDGNTYPAVRIGEQVWMGENLRVTHYRDGTAIPDGTGAGQYPSAAYSFAFDDDPVNVAAYGRLYTGHAAKNAGLCPDGWRVPTWTDVETLWLYLGWSTSGGKLKEAGTAHWEDPNKDATNLSGFGARGGGWRTPVSFYDLRHNAFFWSSTDSTAAAGELYYFQLNTTHGGFIPGADPVDHAYSVRCLKE